MAELYKSVREFAMIAMGTVLATPAVAGPWTMPKGEGRVINTTIYSHAGHSFDGDSHSYDAPDYDQLLSFFETEYGLTDDITIIADPSLRKISIEHAGNSFGLGPTELGARFRLFHDSNFVLSAQTTAFLPGTSGGSQVAQIGSNDTQADARIQAGYGFSVGKFSGFTSVEGGYRLISGNPPNEFHGDATIGIHGSDRLLIIANLFNTWSDGRGSGGFQSYRYSNLYAGGVYALTQRFSLQLGGLATVTGRNALRERGIYSGFWLKF
jgi:hypothetical protein